MRSRIRACRAHSLPGLRSWGSASRRDSSARSSASVAGSSSCPCSSSWRPSRLASATSLAAIGITALFGAASFGVLGEVSWADAVVIGLPAVVGVLVGTALQQRVSSRLLVALLGVLLVAIAIRLLLE